MYSVLVASRSFGRGTEREVLTDQFHRLDLNPTYLALSDAVPQLAEFEGLIVGTEHITYEILCQAKRLRVVVKYGVGTDNIDVESARLRGVQVLNLPAVNATTVAEMALAMILALARRIPAADRAVRQGRWERLIGSNVVGKTLGIIGTGSIGCSLARMVSGLSMTVIGSDVIENPDFVVAGGHYVAPSELLARSDFVTLHLPLNDETVHYLNDARLALMKRDSYLINTSRGKIVDESAVARALSEGRLAGAALDVFASEPLGSSPLVGLESTVLTPHISAYTLETLREMDSLCLSTLSNALHARRS